MLSLFSLEGFSQNWNVFSNQWAATDALGRKTGIEEFNRREPQ